MAACTYRAVALRSAISSSGLSMSVRRCMAMLARRDDLPRPMMCLVDMGAGGLAVFPVALMRPRLSGTVDSVRDVATTCSGEVMQVLRPDMTTHRGMVACHGLTNNTSMT
uniref:Uncharacterized protein K0023E10.18 n=1 Tax=Oryza sativa subsp. indica TaxID=39946 RepID=C8TEU5_ORYSI|nr:hypothetical protein [Oryza sativa Indica Group]BAI39716.1 hypothetical protein [Oryza sativa Indica Group]